MARRLPWKARADSSGKAPDPEPDYVDATPPEPAPATPSRTGPTGPSTTRNATTASSTPAQPAKATELAEPTEPAEPTERAAVTDAAESPTSLPRRLGRGIADATPVLLLRAAHPRQAVVTALVVGAVAFAIGREPREAAVVAATVLVGQAILGWHNDIVDRERDARHGASGKPIADGRLDAGTAWYAVVVAVLLLVPLSISTGVTAGTAYLVSVVVGLLGNVALREGRFSALPWAASFALLPSYVALGGWGGAAEGDPPLVAITVAAAFLGVGVHVLRAIWGLVADEADGWTYLPLWLGRRIGATRLLVVTAAYLVVVAATMLVLGATVGFQQ